jgi:hypothetical protein
VQWVSEKNQSCDVPDSPLRRDVRRHAASHRFAADEQRQAAESRPRRVDRLSPRTFEHRCTIGRASSGRDVGKIERGDREPPRRQLPRRTHHELAHLSGAGAVRQHQGREWFVAGVHF